MKKIFLLTCSIFICSFVFAQKKDIYIDNIRTYQKNYVADHEVVSKKDKKHFHFFPINKAWLVTCYFEKINDTTGFAMNTSAGTLKHYYKYGRLDFLIDGKECRLYVYQSRDLMSVEKYKDYLFVPFTDPSNGDETYGSGRYLEFFKQDIAYNPGDSLGTLQLDFNKAYNPYCAYAAGYKCPIPPKENRLPVAVKAGEKNFGKAY